MLPFLLKTGNKRYLFMKLSFIISCNSSQSFGLVGGKALSGTLAGWHGWHGWLEGRPVHEGGRRFDSQVGCTWGTTDRCFSLA